MIERLRNPEQHDIDGWMRRATELDAEVGHLRAEINSQRDEIERWIKRADKTWHSKSYEDEIASLRAEVKALRSALLGLLNNSTRADWPDDLYDAAVNAAMEKP